MAKKFKASGRKFINRANYHTDASIAYDIQVHNKGYIESILRIRDCSQTVELDLGCHSSGSLKNSEFKIDTMIAVLLKAKEDLKKAHEVHSKIKNDD